MNSLEISRFGQWYAHLPVYRRTFTKKLSGKCVRLFIYLRLGIRLMSHDHLNMKRASERAPNLSKTALDCLKVSQKLPKKSRSIFNDLFFKTIRFRI